MNRLSYARKFTLVGLLVMTPTAFLFALQFDAMRETINFTAKELQGAEYIEPARRLLYALELCRINIAAQADTQAALRDNVAKAVAELDTVDRRLGAELRTSAEWQKVKGQWLAFEQSQRSAGSAAAAAAAADVALGKLGAEVTNLILNYAGNFSNLILDPDLDSYWIMDAFVVKLPALEQTITEMTVAAMPSSRGAEDGAAMLMHLAGLEENAVMAARALAEVNLATAFAETHDAQLAPELQQASVQAIRAVNTFAAHAHAAGLAKLAAANTPTAAATVNLTEDALEAMREVHAFYDKVGPALVRLMEARLAVAVGRRTQGAAIFGAAAALLAYLFLAFYFSIRQSLRSFSQATSQAIAGTGAQAAMSNNDELGEMAGQMLREIAERKKMEQIKDEFVSIVSHELRTPLTSICGSLGLVSGGVAGELPPKAVALIGIAHKNAERLVRLINDILDVQKIEAGSVNMKMRVIDLVGLAEQVVAGNEGFAAHHNITLQFVKKADSAKAYGDADRLTQVITNLLSNAIKFSKAGDTVEVVVSIKGSNSCIAIVDHGPGIPEAFRDRIFQKFAQADSSATRKVAGTGLGLSISKAIVERHGGSIGFETVLDQGSTFSFEIPLQLQLKPQAPAKGLEKSRILVCEDDEDVATILSTILERAGYECDQAYTAAQAWSMLQKRSYAAMTLDITLPDADGLVFLRELRGQPETRALPVVVVSGKTSEGLAPEDLEAVRTWLHKPIEDSVLVKAIKSAAVDSRQRARILHVEDDPDVATVVRMLLQDLGDVTTVATVESGRDALKSRTYDLVILDLQLPDGSGTDLLPHINALEPPTRTLVYASHETDISAFPFAEAVIKTQVSTNALRDLVHDTLASTEVPQHATTPRSYPTTRGRS